MKKPSTSSTSVRALAGAVLCAALVAGAQAADRQHGGSYTTGKGGSGTYKNSSSGNLKDG